MARTKKQERKKGGHSEAAMKKAIELVEAGMSIRQASKICQLSYPTVRNYVRRKLENPSQTIRLTPNYEVNKVFTSKQELELVKYIEHCAETFNDFSSKDCRRIAYQMAKVNNKKKPQSWVDVQMAGQEWLRSFRQRHPHISLRKSGASSSIAKGNVFDKKNIDSFFCNLLSTVETGLSSENSAVPDDTRVFISENSATTVHKPRIIEDICSISQHQEPETTTPSVECFETPHSHTKTNSEASQEQQFSESHSKSTSELKYPIKPLKNTRKRRNPKMARKKGNNSREDIKKGILLVRNGISIRRAGKAVGVPYATLKRYCDKTKNCSLEDQRLQPNYAVNKVFDVDQELLLKNYINYCDEIFSCLYSKECQQLAFQFAKNNKIKVPTTWERSEMAGKYWLTAFRERHSFIVKKPESSRAIEFNDHNLTKLYDDWQNIVKKNTAFSDFAVKSSAIIITELEENSDEYDEAVIEMIYNDDDDEQVVEEEYQVEVDQDEVNYDVCKLETVEHSFTVSDEDKGQFVPATKENMPEVNMFAVVEYITNNEKELKHLDYSRLKILTKNNPHLISSPLVLPCSPTYRLRATVTLEHTTSHMCEVEYNTDTDTLTQSECVCGNDVCQHTAAFVMWLANKPMGSSTIISKDNSGGDSGGPMLKKSQVSDSQVETKPFAGVVPSTSRVGGRDDAEGDQPLTKRPRVAVAGDVEGPAVSDTAVTVAPLPKDEDEPDKSKIECTFPRKTIYTLWKNVTGTILERSKKIQTTLRTQLQDDDFVIDFTPIEQRIEQLCVLFGKMKGELHKSENSEFMNIKETLVLNRVSKGKSGSLRDPLS